jgi:5-methylcytosine-specific restriction enzyme subunit McrC
MILLNYHPDIQGGSNSVLALMFDMNILWEKFVYISLKKNLKDYKVSEQVPKLFWSCESRQKSIKIKPDIVIDKGEKSYMVLDTKWKNLDNNTEKISNEDLKQVFVYSIYFKVQKVALIYPGNGEKIDGKFEKILNETEGRECDFEDKSCDLISIPVTSNVKVWQKEIANLIINTSPPP